MGKQVLLDFFCEEFKAKEVINKVAKGEIFTDQRISARIFLCFLRLVILFAYFMSSIIYCIIRNKKY